MEHLPYNGFQYGIILIGAGKGAEIAIKHFGRDRIMGVLDDQFKGIAEIPCLGPVADWDSFPNNITKYQHEYLITFSTNMTARKELYDAMKTQCIFTNLVRSKGFEESQIGYGNIIFPNVEIDWFAHVGNNNVISHNTVINHHCQVGSSNLFGPGCLLSGGVRIGDGCIFGSGVIIQPNVVIGNNCRIASGTVIVGDINKDNLEGNFFVQAKRNLGDKNHVVLQGDRNVSRL